VLVLPPWLAARVQVPTLTSVTVAPATVQMVAVLDLNVTARPDEAVAVSVAPLTLHTVAVVALKATGSPELAEADKPTVNACVTCWAAL